MEGGRATAVRWLQGPESRAGIQAGERATQRRLEADAIVAAVPWHALPGLLPEEWRARLPTEEPGISRHVADFIAGMTDRYAVARYREVVGPIALPDGF